MRGDVKGWVGGCGEVRFELLLVQPLGGRVCEQQRRPTRQSVDRSAIASGTVCYLQVDDDIGIHVALDAGIAVAHHVVPHAAIAALGHQLLPPRAAKGVLALVGAQLDDRVQEGQVEAPDLHARAPRGGCDGGAADEVARVAVGAGLVERRRGDDGLNCREGFGEASREKQLGSLSVGFGNLRRLLPRGRERRHGRRQVARPADVLVQRRHAL